MARPRKEGMDYFPHDTDAANDKKIKALRMLYGNDGYTFYFILLEMIYREPNFELDVSDAETIQILSKECGINDELFNQILKTAIKRDCFDRESYEEREVLTSNGIKKRASVVVDKRIKMQEKHAQKVSDAENRVETPQSKVKDKVIVKEVKDRYAEFVTMTEIEYQKLKDAHGESFVKKCIEELDNHKGAKGQTYKSDYRAILKWVVGKVKEDAEKAKGFRPTNKQQTNLTVVQPTDQERKELQDARRKQQERNGVKDAVNI